MLPRSASSFFFFFNDTATTEIYTLSLHDALPICFASGSSAARWQRAAPSTRRCRWPTVWPRRTRRGSDRKSTRLNSSHQIISYAVFCLKKKKKEKTKHAASRDRELISSCQNHSTC